MVWYDLLVKRMITAVSAPTFPAYMQVLSALWHMAIFELVVATQDLTPISIIINHTVKKKDLNSWFNTRE